MRFLFFVFVLIAVNCGGAFSQTLSPKKIVGIYQNCPYNCDFLKINGDYTFDFLVNPGVGDPQRIKGSWRFIGENKIHLTTKATRVEIIAEEQMGEAGNKILIQTLDASGALMPNVKLIAYSNQEELKFSTNVNGEADIPLNSEKILVEFAHHDAIYRIKNPNTTKITMQLPGYFDLRFDDFFTLQKNKICPDPKDGIVFEFCYEKTKKFSGKKLFPKEK